MSKTTEFTDRKARTIALTLLEEAVRASDPRIALRRVLRLSEDGKTLRIGKDTIGIKKSGRIYVVGGGKASGAMAEEAENLLGEKIAGGCVSILRGTRNMFNTKLVELRESSHPIPKSDSLEATRRIISIVDNANPEDLIICLISGGGSALLCLPPPEVPLEELQTVIEMLQKHGVTIRELNTVRKHFSLVKGGRLAEKAASKGCEVASIILSDVVGDPLDVIASGPTAPDTTTFQNAVGVLRYHKLWNDIPNSARQYLLKGTAGQAPETPKPGSPTFSRVHNVLIGSNRQACAAAHAKARELNLNSFVLSTMVEGEAREVGKFAGAMAKEIVKYDSPLRKPAAVIMGGETTVTVRGSGKGGRNQELVLSALRSIEDVGGATIAAMGTDGIDGPTEAAGAIIDASSSVNSRSRNLDIDDYLLRNDSNTFFKALGDGLIVTGPTGTNVNDIIVVVAL
ncbi:MAG: glycerate kinase [Promethearchaeati archaeon SRVP18_Atabeyarchaeia-1]